MWSRTPIPTLPAPFCSPPSPAGHLKMLLTLCLQLRRRKKRHLWGRWPGCRNCEDRRAKRASLSASARTDASGTRGARGAGAWPSPGSGSAHARRRPREARRPRPGFPLPKSFRRPPPPPPLRPGSPGEHLQAPKAGGRSRPGPALSPRPRPDGAGFLLQPLLGARDARP